MRTQSVLSRYSMLTRTTINPRVAIYAINGKSGLRSFSSMNKQNSDQVELEALKNRVDEIPGMESNQIHAFVDQLGIQSDNTKREMCKYITQSHKRRKEIDRYTDYGLGVVTFGFIMMTHSFWMPLIGGGIGWMLKNESTKDINDKYNTVQDRLIRSMTNKY